MDPCDDAQRELAIARADWAATNWTETYQACLSAGLRVSPNMSRDQLVDSLIGALDPDEYNPMDDLRDALMGFLLDHWDRVRAQLKCPAGSKDPKACYQCVDIQLARCLIGAQRYEDKINNKRKKI